ncbi:hypothetical protein ASJ33_01475 [Dehalococcoides mccartyi]|uniref:hypothetical protein n=1 Tax=Dehalococcoides mccartyi TaxID=61435 RepID=UPI00090B75F8|nr:hypothetical protein [Dehalococcoides mccartyi]APH11915.1 hypothetical protein ASJ33_01475 [Dehalococcoides mccartyi]
MVTTLCCPQDDNSLSYDRLNGEWAQWFRTAQRFEHKVPTQDREDIRHSIILELALTRARDGNKPFSEAMMCRIASCMVAQYWRKQYKLTNGLDCGSCSQKQRAKCKADYLYSQCPKAVKIESLNKPITDEKGNVTELGDTIADDKAIDIGAWLDARTFLLSFPNRLVYIAHKRVDGIPLTGAEMKYLCKWRKREQKILVAG